MAKIDKSQYTKAEWKVLKEQRRQSKRLKLLENTIDIDNVSAQDTAFVIGNGKSRLPVNLEQIKTKGNKQNKTKKKRKNKKKQEIKKKRF